MTQILLALFLSLPIAAAASRAPLPPELPEDLGPATIDVSSYPAEYQQTYREIFLPLFGFLRGGPARAINSPLTSSDEWRREVTRIKNRPPCCGACPILSRADALKLWRFLTYDSVRRKTGASVTPWVKHRRSLIEQFNIAVKKGGSQS